MVRIYLTCDICGSKWDITDTDYAKNVYPGTMYIHTRVKEGIRNMIIQNGKVTDDDRLERNDMDICDKCYNKIDRFIFDLKEGGSDEESD